MSTISDIMHDKCVYIHDASGITEVQIGHDLIYIAQDDDEETVVLNKDEASILFPLIKQFVENGVFKC